MQCCKCGGRASAPLPLAPLSKGAALVSHHLGPGAEKARHSGVKKLPDARTVPAAGPAHEQPRQKERKEDSPLSAVIREWCTKRTAGVNYVRTMSSASTKNKIIFFGESHLHAHDTGTVQRALSDNPFPTAAE